MFTGLVQMVGTVGALRPRAQSKVLQVRAPLRDGDRALGASVAIAGVCLTVTASTSEWFEAEAAFETLARTTLGALRVGETVNLEPALRFSDPLGGHLVSGHVDGIGALRSSSARGDAALLWFDAPADLRRFIAVKGSICVDGVSLTVNEIDEAGFAVGLITHTLAVTTLGSLRRGAAVNLEVDLIARYVERLLSARVFPAGLTLEGLARAGYLDHKP